MDLQKLFTFQKKTLECKKWHLKMFAIKKKFYKCFPSLNNCYVSLLNFALIFLVHYVLWIGYLLVGL